MTDKDKTGKPSSKAGAEAKKPAKASEKPAAKAAPKKKAAKPVAKKSPEELQKANDAIKSKQAVDELKQRAHEAKLRAQKKILEKSYVSDPPVDPLERLANTFDHSARRWEMVVYPSLFAFVLLAGYGFFLIYRLTHDISTLSHSVTRMAVIVSEAMPRMTKDLGVMTGSMDNMTENISSMSGDVKGMTTEISSMSGQMNTLTPMSQNISNMTGTMNEMNRSVYGMQRDMGGMNRTISSGPFGMMNDFMPFSSRTNVTPPLPPPTYRQPWEVRPQLPQKSAVAKPRVPAKPVAKVKPGNKPGNKAGKKTTKSVKEQPARHGSGLTRNHLVAATGKK